MWNFSTRVLHREYIMVIFACLMLVAIAQPQKPNFVVILTDDQGFDDYGFRQPPLETPVMEKMVRDGVQFTRFYTGATCAPTRSSLMTGRNYMKTGTTTVGFGGDAPHLDEYMLGDAMRDAGYVTGMVGKWNLGTSDAEIPWRRGFDESWEVAKENIRFRGRYDHFNPPFHHNGTYTGIEFGWQVELATDKGINFIEQHKEEPFFLYLPYASPHEPWLCRKELQEKYMNMGISENYAMLLGMIEQLDTQIGRVLQALEDNGLSDNTIVVLFGDNGPTPKTRLQRELPDGFFTLTGEEYELSQSEWAARNPTGLRGEKNTGWENGVRNRLTVYCPAKFDAKEVREMTVVMDVYPTLLDLAGVTTRKQGAPPLDGLSLRPLLDGNPNWPIKRRFIAGQTGTPQSHQWVVVNDYDEWSLFKVNKDPQQTNDRQGDKPGLFTDMQKQFDREVRKIRKDPHAWSVPVQVIGIPGVDEPYLEMSYTFRMKGLNRVSWSYTFFEEVGAIQELKVRVLKPATYMIKVHALGVPTGTRVRIRVGTLKTTRLLKVGERDHELGSLSFEEGDQNISVSVVECGDLEALRKMEVYNLRLTEVR